MKQVTQIDAVTDAVSSFFDYALGDGKPDVITMEHLGESYGQQSFIVYIRIKGINLLPVKVEVRIELNDANCWVAQKAYVTNSWYLKVTDVSFEKGNIIIDLLPSREWLQYALTGNS